MIHRAPFGSMERFCAVLIEHTAGHFPLWLTPDQVAILPISESSTITLKNFARILMNKTCVPLWTTVMRKSDARYVTTK